MSVFPESLKKVDTNNLKKGVGSLETYVRYMCERLEFSVGKVAREASLVTDSEGRLLTELSKVKDNVNKTHQNVEEKHAAIDNFLKDLQGYKDDIQSCKLDIAEIRAEIARMKEAINHIHGGVF